MKKVNIATLTKFARTPSSPSAFKLLARTEYVHSKALKAHPLGAVGYPALLALATTEEHVIV